MAQFRNIALLTIDDADLVVVLLDSSFNDQTPEQQRTRRAAFEVCAARAGLKGTLVMLWQDSEGRTRFLAPPEQHAFFQIVSYSQLSAQADQTLEC